MKELGRRRLACFVKYDVRNSAKVGYLTNGDDSGIPGATDCNAIDTLSHEPSPPLPLDRSLAQRHIHATKTTADQGSKQRRRILNRLRRTHSPEHVGRDGASSRTESTTRWSLVERAYAALQDTGDAGDSIKPSRAHPGVDVGTTEEEDARLNSNSIATFDTEL